MCGIYGQYNFGSLKPVRSDEVKEATRTIAHRGPDDEGYFFAGPLGLGFRRLSIIDLSGGHQPMSDAGETVWIVFNGEIYNFRGASLRARLPRDTSSERDPIPRPSSTATRSGASGVFDRLNGMFGLAIWDVRERKLVVARDAMGIKPVYYRLDAGSLFFASEVRALVSSSPESIGLDPVSLNLFLRYRYTPSPKTLFEGVSKLAPGTMLVVEDGCARGEALVSVRAGAFRQTEVDSLTARRNCCSCTRRRSSGI